MNDISVSDARNWFRVLALYLIIFLAQPQAIIPAIAVVRPGMIASLALAWFVWKYRKLIGSLVSDQAKLVMGFVFLLFALVPLAHNPVKALNTATSMLIMLPCLLSIPALLRSEESLRRFMWLLCLITGYLSVYSVTHGGKGPGGIVIDENDFTLFIVLVMPFLFTLVAWDNSKGRKLVLLIIALTALVAIVAAISRGGFVGLLAMLLVYWIYSKRKFFTIMLIMVLLGFVYVVGGGKYAGEMSTITDTKESTANERLLSWQAGWSMFLDNPLGVGGNNYQVLFPNYQPPEMRKNMWGRVAHSIWFTLIPETGLIGIWIFSFILWKNFRVARDMADRRKSTDLRRQHFGQAFLASFAGFLGAASFISVLYYPHFWYMTMLLVSADRVSLDKLKPTR